MKEKTIYLNKLIAHRGYHDLSKNIPENSLASFKRAIIMNYHIELDIRMTKDEKIIVFHDKSLERACEINKNIKDLTYEELKTINIFNTTSKIPLLKEVLELDLTNTTLFIDIKYGTNKDKLIKLLQKYNVNYVILSFFERDLIWFKRKHNSKTGLLITNLDFRNKKRYIIDLFKPDFLVCNINMFGKEKLKKYRKIIPIIGWTIKTEQTYFKYKKYYDNLICENMNNF